RPQKRGPEVCLVVLPRSRLAAIAAALRLVYILPAYSTPPSTTVQVARALPLRSTLLRTVPTAGSSAGPPRGAVGAGLPPAGGGGLARGGLGRRGLDLGGRRRRDRGQQAIDGALGSEPARGLLPGRALDQEQQVLLLEALEERAPGSGRHGAGAGQDGVAHV